MYHRNKNPQTVALEGRRPAQSGDFPRITFNTKATLQPQEKHLRHQPSRKDHHNHNHGVLNHPEGEFSTDVTTEGLTTYSRMRRVSNRLTGSFRVVWSRHTESELFTVVVVGR